MSEHETSLVSQAKAGDHDAFRQLVERHSPDIFRLAYRLTGGRESADDVVQEAFLKAYRALHRFDGRSSFATWLHRIAANTAMDFLRRAKREQAHCGVEDPSVFERRETLEPGPERLAWSGQIEQRLHEALAKLSPLERSAFILRHFEQQSIAEIGRQLGSRTSATKHAVFRAVRKLREELAPWMEARNAKSA